MKSSKIQAPEVAGWRVDGDTVPARDGLALPAARERRPGDIIDGRYRLLSELGRGGMGVVFLGEDTRLQRRVAIKFLRTNCTNTDIARFQREAQLLASLSHPHVVKVFDLGQVEGRPYFVMEYLQGATLADVLAESAGDGLPVDVALGFGRHLCEALEAVHRQGIIHRDIKPGNVIVTRQAKAVLMDFGLARREVTANERGLVSGTPEYLAPEEIGGAPLEGDDARRSDIYALGITLYELIAGRPPFTGEDTASVLKQQLYEPPMPLCDLRPDVPAAFERVIMRALEKLPERRQSSCSELVSELAQAREMVVRPAASEPPPVPPMVDREIARPTVERTVGQLQRTTARPATAPAGERPVPTPITGRPVPTPVTERPAPTPITGRPVPTPITGRPVPAATTERPLLAHITERRRIRTPTPHPPANAVPTTAPQRPVNAAPATGPQRPANVALILNGGPLRDSLAEALRAALPGRELAVLPSGGLPIRGALMMLRPECIVIDMDLLDENPFELCGFLRRMPDTAKTSILVVSDPLVPEQEQLLLRMGVAGVVPRPIDPVRLAADVQRTLG